MSIMPQDPDSKTYPPCVAPRALLEEASGMVERLVNDYPLGAQVSAGIWGDFDQWARQRADELTARHPCPTCSGAQTLWVIKWIYDDYAQGRIWSSVAMRHIRAALDAQ